MDNLRIGNKQLIKDINRALVIDQIRRNAPISRTDISKVTNLGLSTVTNIIEELRKGEVVFEKGAADSSGGRRPILLEFNYTFGYTIGIKIEENHIILALTNLRAEILRKIMLSFEKGEEAPNVILKIIEGINELISLSNTSIDRILGIGIAVSGLVNHQKGTVIRSPLLGWENVNLREEIGNQFNIPVYIDNDVNAYTLIELWMGYGKTQDNFICISIGAGVGAGIVIDRKIYYGKLGGAGELGHTIIHLNGHLCHCGQKGCLEMYASDKFLYKEGNLLIGQFPDSVLKESNFTFDEVFQAASIYRDTLAIQLLKSIGEYLGIGLVNVINSLNPETIIFVGEGMIAKEYFLPYAMETANQNFFSKANYHTNTYVSELGNDAWVMGASLLAINHLFQAPIYKNSVSNSLNIT